MSQAERDKSTEQLIGQPSRRVVFVGAGELEQTLRRDADLEVVRAGDAFDAIGLLGDEPAPARPTIVVITPPAEPDGRIGSVADLIAALRRVEPAVRVLRVGRALPPGASAYDGVVEPGASAEDIARLFPRCAHNAVDVVAPPIVVPDPEPPIEPRALAGSGDRALVEAMLRGQTVRERALALVRQRLGRDDIEFRPRTLGDPEPGVLSAVVLAGQKVLGHLIARGTRRDDADAVELAGRLGQASGWLGAWLKLGMQMDELRDAAFTDPLTGAWNRRYFSRFLSAALDEAKRGHIPVTVMLFDIDDFKGYNDHYGHAAGDEILVETVKLLRSVIRPTDRVCRVGGDEFAVIFYEPGGPRQDGSTPPESIFTIATRFQKQICAHRFPKLAAEAQGTLTISGGLATYPWDGTTGGALLRRADELALASKRQGKNVLTLGEGAERVCRTEGDGQ